MLAVVSDRGYKYTLQLHIKRLETDVYLLFRPISVCTQYNNYYQPAASQ